MNDIQQSGDAIMALGALPKPRDKSEDQYLASRVMADFTTANLNQPVSLWDCRSEPIMQGQLGACGQFGAVEGAYVTRNAARKAKGFNADAQLAHPGFLYEKFREKQGWLWRDTGSWPSFGLDWLMQDTPLLSKTPYVSSATHDYQDEVFNDGQTLDYIGGHSPFFVNEGFALERMHNFLSMGSAIVVCCHWADEYFRPVNGVMPEGVQWDPNRGHCWVITDIVDGLAIGPNWWGFFNPGIKRINSKYLGDEIALPFSFFDRTKNSPIMELRAVTAEPIEGVPDPEPIPDPPPGTVPVIKKVKYQGRKKLVVKGNDFHSDGDLLLDNVDTGAVRREDGRFIFKMKGLMGSHTVRIVNPSATSEPFEFTA